MVFSSFQICGTIAISPAQIKWKWCARVFVLQRHSIYPKTNLLHWKLYLLDKKYSFRQIQINKTHIFLYLVILFVVAACILFIFNIITMTYKSNFNLYKFKRFLFCFVALYRMHLCRLCEKRIFRIIFDKNSVYSAAPFFSFFNKTKSKNQFSM